MSSIRIYFEGDKGLRPGFRKFFGDDRRITLISGGGQSTTEEDFRNAEKSHKDSLVLLLIDSDRPLTATETRHPKRYFMVQIMESWFLADRDALARYFGRNFNSSALPRNTTDIESIPKADVERGLDNATRLCSKGRYSDSKVVHGRQLLLLLDRKRVRDASPECDRLLQTLHP